MSVPSLARDYCIRVDNMITLTNMFVFQCTGRISNDRFLLDRADRKDQFLRVIKLLNGCGRGALENTLNRLLLGHVRRVRVVSKIQRLQGRLKGANCREMLSKTSKTVVK